MASMGDSRADFDEAFFTEAMAAKVKRAMRDHERGQSVPFTEASSADDHPYGAWGGGSKSSGGRPGGGGGPSAASQVDPTKPRDRWSDVGDIQKEMGDKYPGSDWSDLSKLSLSDANDAADAIDGLSTRFGSPPNFQGIRVRGVNDGVLAEVRRPSATAHQKGSAVFVYGMESWGQKGSHGGKASHFVGDASTSLRQSKRATVVHEMGHMYLGMNLHSRFGKDRNDPVRQATESFVTKSFMPNYKTAHVSKYGRKNPHEAWAEVFTAAVSPSLGAASKSHFPGELSAILNNDFPIKVSESANVNEVVTFAEALHGAHMTERPDIIVANAQLGHICGFAAAHPEFPLDMDVDLSDV